MHRLISALLGCLSFALPLLAADPVSTREMDRINWMEFRDAVPAKIDTVLLPTGTLEAHGVANNGADNTAPYAMAKTIAPRVNAMIAPTLSYGVTGRLAAYAGGFTVSEEAYRPFVREILEGLARNRFRNIIVLNGHGGAQTAILQSIAEQVAEEKNVRILVINWWSLADKITKEVFGENGGHAGWNETAFIQAIDPSLVHPEKYKDSMALAYPPAGTWFAVPFPATVGLYEEGQGYVKFDEAKAKEYYRRVTDQVATLIQDVIRRWNEGGV
ncbi:MAG TPA: creatininase family protein [Thermoanaerobaculia bacterium]|nr:creatininase family protein [Thermoanaerobaculia bacterium]